MRASIAASATAAPEMPPISAESTIDTWARPPTIQPVSSRAKRSSRSVMPLVFIRLPARMKNGTASSGKDSVAPYMRWIATVIGM